MKTGHDLLIKNIPISVIKSLKARQKAGEGTMSHQIRLMLIRDTVKHELR